MGGGASGKGLALGKTGVGGLFHQLGIEGMGQMRRPGRWLGLEGPSRFRIRDKQQVRY